MSNGMTRKIANVTTSSSQIFQAGRLMLSATGRRMSSQPETYEAAVKLISARRRPKRPDNAAEPGKSPAKLPNGLPSFRGLPPIHGMQNWLEQLGSPHEKLDIIHVAGTKGKGSTAAWIETLLRQHAIRCKIPFKTGLYTSPHLVSLNERIRVNFRPLEPQRFAKYFFDLYDRMSLKDHREPLYLQLLALLSFRSFVEEGVDVAIYETHHGGEFDVTNVISKPLVNVITTIGMDHIDQLGPSVENIAWHKSGIFKAGAVGFTAPQSPSVLDVLKDRANQKGMPLEVVQPDERLNTTDLPPAQQLNCSVAVAACNAYLAQKGLQPLSWEDVEASVDRFRWPGRFHTIEQGGRTLFLDGAHNELSLEQAAAWFSDTSQKKQRGTPPTRVVVYAHISDRDGEAMLDRLLRSLTVPIDHVIFTTYVEQGTNAATNQVTPDMDKYVQICKGIYPDCKTWTTPTISDALSKEREIGVDTNTHVLVTGSLYLIGGVLSLIQAQI